MNQKARRWVALLLGAFDLVAVALSVSAAFWLRFGLVREIPPVYLQNQNRYVLTTFLILMGLELLCGCTSYLAAFSVQDGVRLLASVAGTALISLLMDRFLRLGIPFEVVILQSVVLLLLLLVVRLSVRVGRIYGAKYATFFRRNDMERVLLYGAGEVGRYLCERIAAHPQENLRVVGFVDDNAALAGARVGGIRVLGTSAELARYIAATRAKQVILTMEKPDRATLSRILAVCRACGCHVRRFGTFSELAENELESAAINDIRLEDLLRRESVHLNQAAVRSLIAGRCVMITGGAGSIGSELCRQVLELGASLLVIFDFNENGMYTLDNELRCRFDPARYRLCIGSVRDEARLAQVMEQYHPALLFHAAAHKHVPMMERNPDEAIKNNVFGTLRTARAAARLGVERFILISTDKAVNPANIMGASKRIAELCIQQMERESRSTRFAAVRFGNVLGSAGSVVPHFKAQIEQGGPVTVTHPEMRRYFMTIPEAVQLVLEAGAMAQGGEIFVLDMGEPVKIYDLACDMIRLSGYEPEQDIKIVFTGMREGEKLFEEISLAGEDTLKTASDKIYRNKPVETDGAVFAAQLEQLSEVLGSESPAALFAAVRAMVPTFAAQQKDAGGV